MNENDKPTAARGGVAVQRLVRLYWWIKVVRLSLRWVPRLNIGRMVWWKGEKWMLIQGVCDPAWDLARGERRENHIHSREFKAVQNPVEWGRAFMSAYRFYMGYWYDIWVREGIQPWMLTCNIWAQDRQPNSVLDRPAGDPPPRK